MARVVDELTIRSATDADRPAILRLLADALGWEADDRHAGFFAWKHEANPFGRSFAWVAEDPAAGVVGFRTFLRWRFERPDGTVEAVRAVDTATAPTHRGAGVFSRLTAHGLAEVTAAGVGFVFNTPNEQSLPGYLKLGWEQVGRLPVQLRPRSLAALSRSARSRVPAELWSVPCQAGVSALEAFDDAAALQALLASQPPSAGLRTERSGEFLRWRYGGFAPLGYRAVLAGSTVADGVALFRLRRRGAALECAVVDVVVPAAHPGAERSLVRRALRESGADHAIALGSASNGGWRGGMRSDRLGPILAWRAAAETGAAPPVGAWTLSLGDVELL